MYLVVLFIIVFLTEFVCHRMTKYTINKIFEKAFPTNIWKIEIDSNKPYVAVETRDVETTLASFFVFDFEGNCLMSPCQADGKEWTLDSIQDGYMILKRIGEQTPVQEGIQIIQILNNEVIFHSYEFVLLDVFSGFIHARHRSISSGESIAIDIHNGEYSSSAERIFDMASNKVQYPVTYQQTPRFLKHEHTVGPLWLSKCGHHFLWCYHKKNKDRFDLCLATSNLNQILDQQVILKDMEKMIPQPYFQLGNQVFFMSFNKREIVSYLV